MYEAQYDFRTRLVDALVGHLVGPTEPDNFEVIADPPITKYTMGILFPQSEDPVSPEADHDLPEEESEAMGPPDPPVAMANVRNPSSIGMTFAVDTRRTAKIRIASKAARYEPVAADSEARSSKRRGATKAGDQWARKPVVVDAVVIEVMAPQEDLRTKLAPGLELFCRVRQAGKDGIAPVTVALINTNRVGPTGALRDSDSFFQVELDVSAAPIGGPFLASREQFVGLGDDDDLASYQLVYRHAHAFGVGHGCSVRWEISIGDSHASAIRSTFAPTHELLLADSNPEIKSDALSLAFPATATHEAAVSALREFVDGYSAWLSRLQQAAKSLPEPVENAAKANLGAIHEAVERMRAGIDLLATDVDAWSSFRLMSRAMLEIRSRSDWLKDGKATPAPITDAKHAWRPFQLAFILLCLRGIVQTDHAERSLADLLWFPTGGGKTEAYLGLIAFTVFLRRRKHPSDGSGVTVLMRYTLRLLTIQQFERASMLICACEAIRRRETSVLGADEIAIGLWVGAGGTPNTCDDAKKSLDKLAMHSELELEDKNPVQLRACPWCGHRLDYRNYTVVEKPCRVVIACHQDQCEFAQGLPVHVVDEAIYSARPTLVIATADKFAALPWNDEVAQLFNAKAPTARPPELIIQDELHLISGPLGTLAGLYETAIDYLCTRAGQRPKVIASTATIRRARQQARALFDREVRQFPPPGLDARDSYFAVESPPEIRGTRLYLGLMAPGTSQTTLLVRTYSALLQYTKDLPGDFAAKDPYWTLVGYFNSLRVLGGARMQVQDDVTDRLGLLANETGTEPRRLENRIELTSREPSGAIPGHLKRMAVEYPDEYALDVILATNMISVGVDIDRLGLMVVMGQPQATSEYIQATSRVGRKWPGLVVVLFNSGRSRDRSHYEAFPAYHSALYRQVESTSVTPFSSRARDRGLHGVVIGLARLLVPGFRSNASARRILKHRDELSVVTDLIVDRVGGVSPNDKADARREIEGVLDRWEERAKELPDLVYTARDPHKALLCEASMTEEEADGAFRTLRSLRDVDLSSNLCLVWS
jgi:Helicase conserved C-terminal domain